MQHGVAVDSGVIPPDIYQGQTPLRLGKPGLDLRFSAILQLINSACAQFAQGSGGGFAVCITIGDNHSRAFRALGNAKADTACGAGDNGGLLASFIATFLMSQRMNSGTDVPRDRRAAGRTIGCP